MNSYDDSESSDQELRTQNELLASENKQLQKQLHLYQSFFQHSNDAIFIISLDNLECLAVNDSAMQLLGYTKEDLTRKPVVERILPEGSGESRDIIERLLAGAKIPPYEYTFRREDGTDVILELEAALICDHEGKPHHIQMIGRDVTQRQKTEQLLQLRTTHWQNMQVVQEIGKAISSSLDLNRVLNIIATQVTNLLKTPTCTIMLFEPPDDLVWIASVGLEEDFVNMHGQKANQGLAGWVSKHRQTLQVENVSQNKTVLHPDLVNKHGYTTYLGVPMLIGDNLVGIIEVYDKLFRSYTDDEIAMLEAVAVQAAAAVERARLFAELNDRVNEVEWQYRATRALSSELDTLHVLQKLAEYLAEALSATSVYISEMGQGQTLVLVNEYWADTAVFARRINPSETAYHAHDFPNYFEALRVGEIRTLHVDSEHLAAKEKELFNTQQVKSILLVPIIRAGITYGLAEIWDTQQKRIFGAQDIRLAETIAQHAASVIESVHLFEQVSKQADQLEKEVDQRTAELLDSNNKLRREIIERQRVEQKLKNQTDSLLMLNKIAGTTFPFFDVDKIYQHVVDILIEYPRFSGSAVLLLNKNRDTLEAVAFAGLDEDAKIAFAQIPVESSLAGHAVRTGKIVRSRNLMKDNRSSLHLRTLSEDVFVGLVCVPIKHNQRVIGILNLLLPHESGITLLEEEMLSSVSNTIGLAIVNARYVSQIETEIKERHQVERALQIYMDELKRSNLELQEFAYIASHDLQEPLRKIQAFGDRLVRQYQDQLDERGVDYLRRMQNAAGRMRLLIDNLLSFSRVTTAAQPFAKVDLNEVMTAVLSDLSIRIQEKNAIVEINDLSTIEAEPTQIHQLLQNLVGNALKFIRPDVQPEVHIEGRHVHEKDVITGMLSHQHMYQLVVRDNGIGIDEKYQERIFNLFERLHSRQHYEGTGLGLAICKKIVVRHNGRIVVKSTPGEGTRFIITLPVTQKQ